MKFDSGIGRRLIFLSITAIKKNVEANFSIPKFKFFVIRSAKKNLIISFFLRPNSSLWY